MSAASMLPSNALTVHTVEYDFEKFALEHGIPETLDPLPYRKAGSVFDGGMMEDGAAANANAAAMEPVLTSAKHDPRLRTVVCRHWLRDLCMKGSACEFLHQYDLAKMPLCRHGERCKLRDCPFRHIAEESRMECAFYKSGFCIHGPFCRYKHVKRPREDLPVVADFSLGLSQMQAGGATGTKEAGGAGGRDANGSTRRPAAKPNEFYKVSLCKHFIAGDCPFGEGCHFAHGEHELRNFPRKDQEDDQADEEDDANFSMAHTNNNNMDHNNHNNMYQSEQTTVDYYQGGAAGGGKPIPIIEWEQAHFCILRAATQADLALSTVQSEWFVQRRHAETLNAVFETKTIMLFFTVSDSNHMQGAALMTSLAIYQEAADVRSGHDADPFCYRFQLEWYRTTELPVETALKVAPDLLLPTSNTQYCLDMTPSTGESLAKAIWNSPLVTLFESWTGDQDPPAPEAILTDFRAPDEESMVGWPTMPGPGFIFGCSSDTMDECLGRGLFGLPAHMKPAAGCIQPGATIFLFNVTDRLLFGIFEALTTAEFNLEPAAFSKNPKATASPFPVQIRVRISLECPPLEDTDPVLNDVLRARGKGRIGVLTYAQTQAVASLLASQCGALQYMREYKEAAAQGRPVRSPPIALPPRKIVHKNNKVHGGGEDAMDTAY